MGPLRHWHRIDRDRRIGIVVAAVALAAQIVLDLVVAALHPGIADQGVFVHCGVAQIVDRQQLRAGVDQLQALQADADLVFLDAAHRRQRDVTSQAEHIAHGTRAEERQFHVARTTPAPGTQGLSEVFIATRHHRLAGRIEQATDAQRAVHQEAAEAVPRVGTTALQQLVGDGHRRTQVAEEVADAGTREARHHMRIGGGQGTGHAAVDRVVELVDLAVERFPRIVGRRTAGVAGAAIQGIEIIVASGGGGRCGLRCAGLRALRRSHRRRRGGRRRIGHGGDRSSVDHAGIGRCGRRFGSRAGRNHGAGDRRIAARGLAGTGGEGGGQDDQGESAYDVHVSSQQK